MKIRKHRKALQRLNNRIKAWEETVGNSKTVKEAFRKPGSRKK
ncbi:MAG: hypothetical protein AABY22_18865 [Nanoarchaeota archaeon]